ncbi:flagellar motor protein MotB [Roseobacteraceae bacterium S113]
MSGDNTVAPVIIKRKKVVGGDGHHGGAWKVAYADFVTAMMAFFMLMWLLNATTETQRKGLADYFSPTIPVNRVSGGGDGAFGGDSVFTEETLPRNGSGATAENPTEAQQARGDLGLSEEGGGSGDGDAELREIEEALMGRGGESFVADEEMKHIVTRVTDEGLLVELRELEDSLLFDDQDQPNNRMRRLLRMIGETTKVFTNQIAVEGHVPANPIVIAEDDSWERSAQRAQTIRLFLKEDGVDVARFSRITGHADREPAVENRMDVQNSRVEIIFLR